MEKNVGATDKAVRIGVGALAGLVSLAILLGTLSLPPLLSPVLGVAAVVLLVTAFTGFCGLYAVLGVDTCPAGSR
jgi:ABC-type transport system involved in multi-copper enzyme maturation permease subunit